MPPESFRRTMLNRRYNPSWLSPGKAKWRSRCRKRLIWSFFAFVVFYILTVLLMSA